MADQGRDQYQVVLVKEKHRPKIEEHVAHLEWVDAHARKKQREQERDETPDRDER